MGIVYEAEDIKLKRKAALKCLLPRLNEDGEYLALFENEIQLQAKIDSRIFARAYSVHEFQGFVFLAMELIDGINLVKYFRGKNDYRAATGPLPVLQVLDIARQVLLGLEEIHTLNIVHRDIKPENLVYQPNGTIRILDLGVGMFCGDSLESTYSPDMETESRTSTHRSSIVGTRAYLSPEGYKLSNKDLDGRSDLYSLGGTLFFLLTGNYPIEWYDPVANDLTPPVSLERYLKEADFHYGPDVVAFLEKLLTPERDLRYQTAEQARADLEIIIDRHSRSFCQRHRSEIKATCVVVTTAVLFSLLALSYIHIDHNRRFAEMADLYDRGEYLKSLAKLESLKPEQLTPEKRKTWLSLSAELYPKLENSRKHVDKAIQAYSELLTQDPERFDYIEKTALLYAQQKGDYDSGRNLVIQALKRYPFSNALKLLDGRLLVMQCIANHDMSESQKKTMLNEAIDILLDVETSAEALYWRGEAYVLLNCPDFALDDFDKSLAIDDDYWLSGLAGAKIRFASMEKRQAEKPLPVKEVLGLVDSLELVLKTIPINLTHERDYCSGLLAQVCVWAGDYAKSVACYDKIHTPGPHVRFARCVSCFLQIVQAGEEISTTEQWRDLLSALRSIQSNELEYFLLDQRAEYFFITAVSCLHLNLYEDCLSASNNALAANAQKVLFHYEKSTWNIYDVRRLAWTGLGNSEEARKDAKRCLETMTQMPVSNALLQ